MLAVRLGLADMPAHAGRLQMLGVSFLCGIGFTMSIFITLLAFPDNPGLQADAKLGVLTGSLLSGLAGYLILRWARRDIKSVNLLAPVLAKQFAAEQGANDAWLVEDGVVTEGASATAWIVKGKTLISRPLSHKVLPGITRKAVLAFLADARDTRTKRNDLIERLIGSQAGPNEVVHGRVGDADVHVRPRGEPADRQRLTVTALVAGKELGQAGEAHVGGGERLAVGGPEVSAGHSLPGDR